MRVAERIREVRKGKGISQLFINQQLGKSASWLCNIEQGRRSIKAEELEMVARALGVPVEVLFKNSQYT